MCQAASHGNPKTLKLLIESGADITAYDNVVLQLAVNNGHYECCEYLLQQGCNPNTLTMNNVFQNMDKYDCFKKIYTLINHTRREIKKKWI
jgi:hypothetical protein